MDLWNYEQHIPKILTHNMLNGFKDGKICIHILVFAQEKKTKFTMEQSYTLSILYYQYHAWWCPGDLKSQGISRYASRFHLLAPSLQMSCNDLTKKQATSLVSPRWLALCASSSSNNFIPNRIQQYNTMCMIITLQCDILALVWLFRPANVTFWTCQCDFSALRLFPASGTLPCELRKYIEID